MIILYIFLTAYIISINFYAFLLIKSFRDKDREIELLKQNQAVTTNTPTPAPVQEKATGKLCITGLLGGAITIYVCMFLFKYKRTDLLLMVLMPLLGVLNIYMFVLLYKSGFGFLLIR